MGQPTLVAPHRLRPDKYKFAKQELQNLMEQGIIRPSKTFWASPIHFFPKGDSDWILYGGLILFLPLIAIFYHSLAISLHH